MNENGIRQYLIDNREKGIAFGFMPPEVKLWIKNHKESETFEEYNGDEDKWEPHFGNAMFLTRSGVYCLSEFTPKWEEFVVDSESHQFNFNGEHYYWWEWQRFLSDNSARYNNFGGWRYENSEYWNTQPQVGLSGCLEHGRISSNYHIKTCVIPANPVRIRFWRYAE